MSDEELRKLAERLGQLSKDMLAADLDMMLPAESADPAEAASAILSLMSERDEFAKGTEIWMASFEEVKARAEAAENELEALKHDLERHISIAGSYFALANLAETRLARAVEALREAHEFIDGIAGHGYGGMASYEIARESVRSVLSDLEPSLSHDNPSSDLGSDSADTTGSGKGNAS